MEIAEVIFQKARALPRDKQQLVLDFVKSLEAKGTKKPPLRSVEGLCADLGVDITEEDIAEARREMWGNFPREDI